LRRLAEYLDERVAGAAEAIQHVPSTGASGVRWAGDTVLTTGAVRAVLAVRAPAADSLRPPLPVAPDSVPRGWVLVVARRADGRVASVTGLAGGRGPRRCAAREVDELVVGAPLDDGLAGAGVFDLDGRLLGMVVRCGERVAALPVAEVRRLLADATPDADALGAFGLTVDSLGGPARAYFGADSGALVTSVRLGGPADAAGLRPGDVLVAGGDRPLAPGALRVRLAAAGPGDTLVVARRRGRAVAPVRLVARPPAGPAPGAELGLTLDAPAGPGVGVATVRPGSAGADAGLRPGDRLLRVGDAAVTSAAAAARALAAADTAPAFLVFQRGAVVRGALTPARGDTAGRAPGGGAP
jgi:hypothetical protein